TDADGLGDFSEVRLGWDVGVVGQLIRHVFPDPTLRDTDGDGLTDKEEQDVRIVQCACDARGPKSLLGSGSLLREASPSLETGAEPCRTDDDCDVFGGTSCIDAVHCSALAACPPCGTDVTLNRTDPRLNDSDADGVTDSDEVFGYLTGAGIVDPSGNNVIVAGADLKADTPAPPQKFCFEDANKPAAPRRHCMTEGGRFCHNLVHPLLCPDGA